MVKTLDYKKLIFANLALALILLSPQFVFSGIFGLDAYLSSAAISVSILAFGFISLLHSRLTLNNLQLVVFVGIISLLIHSIVHQDFSVNQMFIFQLAIFLFMLGTSSGAVFRILFRQFEFLILSFICIALIGFLIFQFDGLFVFKFYDFAGHEFIWNGFSTYHTNNYHFFGNVISRQTYFFDEPGTAGFFILVLMGINKSSDDSRVKEAIYLVGGTLTFSLFFIICAFIYLVFFFSIRKLVFLAIISVIFIVIEFEYLLNFLSHQVVERLMTLETNNRMAGILNSLECIRVSPLLGCGREDGVTVVLQGSGFIRYAAQFGVLIAMILVTPVLILGASLVKHSSGLSRKTFFVVVFLGMLLHREHIIQISALTVLSSGVAVLLGMGNRARDLLSRPA